ncbi:MAG: tRNA 2-thiouridine(34) synthase MnmA [Bacteroidales bacterium]
MREKKRVVVGLSGGVDSSVAAHLLLEQGYEVVGVFMRNWHDESVTLSDACPWIEDSNDAMMVAQKLGIPFSVLDFSEPYRKRIVEYMFAEYQAGRTPNPDVLCNREIKFDVFLEAARKLGADFVATGHYCRKASDEKHGKTVYRLLAGSDPGKDQSYFLCQLSQEQLSKALFPIGHLHKTGVRKLAASLGLVTAEKKDSQGLCFVGKVRLPDFLQQQLKPKEGDIVLIPPDGTAARQEQTLQAQPSGDEILKTVCAAPFYTPDLGTVVGQHTGAHYFTVGQRKGLNTGGMEKPIYVLATDTKNNIVYTGMGDDHPGLYRKGLFVHATDIHWIRGDLRLLPGQNARYLVRIRYREPLGLASLSMRENGLYVVFDEDRRGVAPGQFVAWYDGEECIGSGVIA